MKLSWKIGVLFVLLGAVAPATSSAGTSDVFRLQTTLHGVIQRGFTNTVISKVMITADDLINLAQRRTLGTPVPKNEVLALASDCPANELRLLVFDSAAGSNLVTIGTFSNLTVATFTRQRRAETLSQLTVADTSDGTNGITGGSFYYHGQINVATNHCPTSFGGQLTGLLGTAFPFVLTNILSTNFVISCVTNCVDTNCM